MSLVYADDKVLVKPSYFLWLSELIDLNGQYDAGGYFYLVRMLYNKEFYWTIEHDENRSDDGKELRRQFAEENGVDDISAIDGPCTVLEMMIGLAMRMNSEVDVMDSKEKVAEYFWLFVKNLGLEGCTDDAFDVEFVNERVRILVDREYLFDGSGGLFPLKHCDRDQRGVELWYQLQNYLIENYNE